jgi:hypothetical protein
MKQNSTESVSHSAHLAFIELEMSLLGFCVHRGTSLDPTTNQTNRVSILTHVQNTHRSHDLSLSLSILPS